MDEFEYPKALYRDGGAELIWGKPVQTITVSSRGDEVEALAKGWRLHPVGDETDEPITVERVARKVTQPKAKVEE